MELDNNCLILGSANHNIYFYYLNYNNYENTTIVEFNRNIIKIHYNKKYNELIILSHFQIDFLNIEDLSFIDNDWKKGKYIFYFIPINDDTILLSRRDIWFMDLKSHALSENIGESLCYDWDPYTNKIELLNDGSLFIVKVFYSYREDPKSELHIWKRNENKEWVISKEEEFEGKNLSIDKIYVYENHTLIFNSNGNGIYSIKTIYE